MPLYIAHASTTSNPRPRRYLVAAPDEEIAREIVTNSHAATVMARTVDVTVTVDRTTNPHAEG